MLFQQVLLCWIGFVQVFTIGLMSGKILDLAGDGGRWFAEINEQWLLVHILTCTPFSFPDIGMFVCRPGQAMCIKLEDTLFEGSSDFQAIAIHNTTEYGRMMTIDGCIQSTERDEFAYHEMMAHVPLFCHPNPEDICIIGGGDGGVLREVLRHDCVRSGAFCDAAKSYIFDFRRNIRHACGRAV